jgi:hypothetical protein
MDFQSPQNYSKLEQGPSRKYEKEKFGLKVDLFLPTILLPRGVHLYRTDEKNASLSETVPNFFSNIYTAHLYQGRRTNEEITEYQVKEAAVLLDLNIETIQKLQVLFESALLQLKTKPVTSQTLKEIQWHEKSLKIFQLYLAREENGVYPTIPASMYRHISPENSTAQYLNRDVANILCAMGFDGWIVMPYNSTKGEGLLEYSLRHNGKSKFVEYYPEVMLCNHIQHLKKIGTKMYHATHRHKTRHYTRHANTKRHTRHKKRHNRHNRRNQTF